MATVKKFEELEVWKLSRELCNAIWTISQQSNLSKDFSLNDQIQRSSGSCMDNIAEGFERGNNKEFIYFLAISKGSIAETRSQLYRLVDRNYINQNEFSDLEKQTLVISEKLGSLIKYLKNSTIKGSRYKMSGELEKTSNL